jgi:hypothetical protein
LPPPVQPAVCAAAGEVQAAPRIPIAAIAITTRLRIDTHTLRKFFSKDQTD